jgi:DNA gyrase/topoisomerase IV subunit A
MSAYLKLNQAAQELKKLQKEAAKFNKVYAHSLQSLDLGNIEITDTMKIRNALAELKSEAKALIDILSSLFSGGVRRYAKSYSDYTDTYTHGRYGQLKGEAELTIFHLETLLKHLDILGGAAAEGKKRALTLVAAKEAADIDGDKSAIYSDGLAAMILLITLIKSIKIRIR